MALPHHADRRPRGSRTGLSVLLVAAFLAAGCSRTSGTQAAEDPREVSPAPSPASTAPWTPPPAPTGPGTPTPADAPASAAPADAAPSESAISEAPPEPPSATPAPTADAVPAMPDFPTDTIPAEKAAAALQARGQNPRSNPIVRAADFACLAYEVRPICSAYLGSRGLGTSVASARTYHPHDETPDPARPRPLPILPPGCVIAATVATGHLVTCADDS